MLNGFELAWYRARTVRGWLSEREARLLWDAAQRTPRDGLIVEVGAYRGTSTTLLAETGRRVVTHDPLVAGFGVGNNMHVDASDPTLLSLVVARYPNVKWIRAMATDAAVPPRVDLIYIDGDHTGDAPLRDYRHFAGAIPPGGLAAFHDYGDYPAVTSAVDQLIKEGELGHEGQSGSMFVGRKLRP